MTFTVSLTVRAKRDFNRLVVWLSVRDARAAARLGPLLEEAVSSLVESPLRGRSAGSAVREINLPFGQHAYIVRYRVHGSQVTVVRFLHSLQQH
ncbi:type II toxin-antitoxin system RelE/ParE family toxin [Caulobacter sp.]|uniref:type II toxin-antitoxin system RelE/ParE family toxin n=1 Tax=Caulobacter sp. TaxID=78 RepID=UPI001B2F69A3|nr:type II toxin-antitoxin system RelE/ParE family toxin [Caulobacter sp.]MBO9543740.1 type II toxin-antitoxin system RelE/ParE family toxin [Caulobacter sp.]